MPMQVFPGLITSTTVLPGSRRQEETYDRLMLVGRDPERSRLLHLLDGARAGTSGVMVIRGEAGVGKSALLDEVVTHADGASVLRVRGVESEAELPYAALHRLLRVVEKKAGRR